MQNKDSGEHEFCFIKTNGENKDFVCMCGKLDQYLDGIVVEKSKEPNIRRSIH